MIFIARTPDSYRFDKAGAEVRYPRCTRILSPLSNFAGIPADVLAHAAERGTAVHRACELLVGGGDGSGLDVSTLHEEVLPYVVGFQKFLFDTSFRIVPGGSEMIVRSDRLRYAGTLDLLGEMPSAKSLLLIDIKTPSHVPATAGPQTASLSDALRDMTGEKKQPRRFALQLTKDERYVMHEYKDHAFDSSTFISCLNIHRWREKYAA